ncbi:uracil-DNA glycosylase [Candidatus Ishikawella capsulata]|nr:uracil-DNA glycosylase [Candidatus Ishikawaella capsulata]
MNHEITWYNTLNPERKKKYFINIMEYLAKQRAAGVTIYPAYKNIFKVFTLTKLHEVKIVILGQDPYHGQNQAHGLAFSVQPGIAIPPSLGNIYKELENDILGFQVPNHGFLESWSQQGVMLLNSVLTVEAKKAFSHKNLGWEFFTDKVISVINNNCKKVIFMLWGSHAQKKSYLIDDSIHYLLKAPHPSPLSAHRGFLGCHHFSQANNILKQIGKQPINWIPKLRKIP